MGSQVWMHAHLSFPVVSPAPLAALLHISGYPLTSQPCVHAVHAGAFIYGVFPWPAPCLVSGPGGRSGAWCDADRWPLAAPAVLHQKAISSLSAGLYSRPQFSMEEARERKRKKLFTRRFNSNFSLPQCGQCGLSYVLQKMTDCSSQNKVDRYIT